MSPQNRLAGKRAASLLLPPQRTAQATFTAYGSGTAKASIVDTGLAIPRKSFADVISLVHLIAETRALNCHPAASSKLPYVEPQILVRDSHTSRKSAPFQAEAKVEPLCTPLQHAIRFLRVLLPAPSTASLAGHLPLTRCPEPVARDRAYHVPVSADPATTWACPVSTCLSPVALWRRAFNHEEHNRPPTFWLEPVSSFGSSFLTRFNSSSLTLCIRNLPRPHTARLLAVSDLPRHREGLASAGYFVPGASHSIVANRACPGRQLLVAQQVAASTAMLRRSSATRQKRALPPTTCRLTRG
jgi:hypothetical protein